MACDVQVGSTITANLTLVKCDGTTPLDISAQTAMEIVVLGPGAVRVSINPSFVTDGTDGQITGVFASTTFTVSGEWKIQAKVTLAGGIVYRTEVKTFKVKDNI